MRRIGIIGGMSYESTTHYYYKINRIVHEKAGGQTSAELVLRSVNFQEYYDLMQGGYWDYISERLVEEVCHLWISDGCDYVAIATNTMHKVVDAIELIKDSSTLMPLSFVHIGDCVAERCHELGATNVLLLGTDFTMTEEFMKNRLLERGVNCFANQQLSEDEVRRVDRIIFDELCHGIVNPESKKWLVDLVERVVTEGTRRWGLKVDAVVLGCTELNMILAPEDLKAFGVPIVDSTQAHIEKLAKLCLS